jgi:oligopeptide transport system permease protein
VIKYVFKKIFTFFLSCLFIVTLTFILMKSIPGDPFIQEQEIPQEILTSLYKHYGLDQPLYIQYLKYLKGFFTCDLGPSYIYQGRTVNQIIQESFFISMTLGLQALVLAIFFGITFGSFAALKKNRWPDTLAILIAIIGISMPNFLLSTLLQYFFSIKMKLLPVARWGTFAHTILPSIALAAMPTAFIARLIRNNMVEILEQDYIKTAYAKGLNHFQVIVCHGLRNALIPVISYLGPIATYVLTGSFVIERIFGIPGLGQWLIHSISDRDYTVIMGLTVFFSVLLMSIVLITDIIIAFLDPRIKLLNSKSSL